MRTFVQIESLGKCVNYRNMGGKLYFLLLCLVETCYLKVCSVEHLAITWKLIRAVHSPAPP